MIVKPPHFATPTGRTLPVWPQKLIFGLTIALLVIVVGLCVSELLTP